jgi:hypothetical protein
MAMFGSWGVNSVGAELAKRAAELAAEGEKWWVDKSRSDLGAAIMRCPGAAALKEVWRITCGEEYTGSVLKSMNVEALLVAVPRIMGTWWEGIPPEARASLVARLSGRKTLMGESLLRACGCDFREADAAVREIEKEAEVIAAKLGEEEGALVGAFGEEATKVLMSYPDVKLEEGEVRDLLGGDRAAQLRAAYGAAVRLGEKGVKTLRLLGALSGLNPSGVLRGPMLDVLGAAAAWDIVERNIQALKDAGIAAPPADESLIKAAVARL